MWSPQDHVANRRLIRRAAIVSFALFIGIPVVGHFVRTLTKPYQPPVRARLFRDAGSSDEADSFAAAATAQLAALYPKTVVRDNGEIQKTGTYRFAVRSPERLTLQQVHAALRLFVVCPVRTPDPVHCPPLYPPPR